MSTIKTLSPELIAKISAGEVVERPVSVVKELVENSIDANATHIDIYIEHGGIKKITVRDDGCGMSSDDLDLSYLPHSTSKLKKESDLYDIRSLGFRGEALSSISAVSLMTIQSRLHDADKGYMIELEKSTLVNKKSIGMACGTEVTVNSLFISTPARKKFLKSATTEFRAITDLVTRIALSHHEISFTLYHNAKKIIDLPHHHNIQERIEALLSTHISRELISVNYTTRYGTITGFIGKPQSAERASHNEYLFVNSRIISHTLISQDVISAYGPLIEPRSYPPFILFLTLPFENVDVNVHPRKEEVSFAHLHEIKKLVYEAVEKSLHDHDLTYTHHEHHDEYRMDKNTASVLRDMITPWNVKDIQNHAILQIKNLYLVTMTDNGLLIVDQHAAHERILFEQFKDAFTHAQKNPVLYTLPFPEIITLSPAQALILEEKLALFESLGFSIEPFGRYTFKISAVPELFKDREYAKLITEVLHDVKDHKKKPDYIDRESERTLAFLACRTAIKGGEALTDDEKRRLIEKLLEAKTLYTCPHGRPTHVELPLHQLDKMFKRA